MAEAEAKKHQAPLRKQAAAASSAAALKRASDGLGGGGGAAAKRGRPAPVKGVARTMDSFVSRESKEHTLAEAQAELEAPLSRLSHGCVAPFAVPGECYTTRCDLLLFRRFAFLQST